MLAAPAEQSRVQTGPGVPPALAPCSAPDYPQFMPDEAERYNNLAAVAVLTGPDWATPNFRQFAAAHPRPDVSTLCRQGRGVHGRLCSIEARPRERGNAA